MSQAVLDDTASGRELNLETVPTAPPAAGVRVLVYEGRTGPLFRLWLKVTLLSIVTLGFYRFWGRTRIRKYLWGHVVLDGEPFEYDGTGGELFRRFLVTLVVLAPILFAPQIAQLAGASIRVLLTVQVLQIVLIFFLVYVGYYAGRRYRLSRTLWCGIRGGLDGHAWRYGLIGMLTSLASLLTLGIFSPWQRVILRRYEARNTVFADRRFAFTGRGGDLVGALLLSALLTVVFVFLAVVIFALAIGMAFGLVMLFVHFLDSDLMERLSRELQGAFELARNGDWQKIIREYGFLLIRLLMLYVVFVFLFGFVFQAAIAAAFSRFQARWFNYVADRTTFGPVRMSGTVDTWRMLALLLGNLLLQLLTFGLARPFIAHRILQMTCANLSVAGTESLRELRQSAIRQRPPAEGLAQLLDSGGFA